LNDIDAAAGSGPTAEFSFDTGWLAEGAVGYLDKNGLRGEITLSYRKNDADEVEFLGSTFDADFELETYSGMANLLYEFDYNRVFGEGRGPSAFRPYFGGGFGAALLDDGSDSDTVFAYQAIGGLAYHLTANWAVTASYVYFATTDPEFDGVEADYESHNVMAGIRFSF